MSKLAVAGWTISNAPKKPIRIADTRRKPTCSPRNIAAAAVTINGTVWITAPIVDIGT